MADKEPKGPPPVKSKTVNRQSLEYGQRADTGGDQFDRARSQYAKNPPVREDDPFTPFDNY